MSLRKSEERFVLAVRGSNDGLWDWDMVSNQVFYSQRYKEMLGLDIEGTGNSFGVFESRLHPKHRGSCTNLSPLFSLFFSEGYCRTRLLIFFFEKNRE